MLQSSLAVSEGELMNLKIEVNKLTESRKQKVWKCENSLKQ